MNRRRLLALVAATSAGLAGCSARPGGSTTTTTRPPARVTTTSAAGVELLVSQLVLRSDGPGPEAFYRFRNRGETDATIAVRTVLRVEGGGEYEASAVVDVPAGDEVMLRYPVVRYEDLDSGDRERLDRGEGVETTVFVNGEERTGA